MIWIAILCMGLGIGLYLFMQSLYRVMKLVPNVKSMRHLTGIRSIGRQEQDLLDKVLDIGEKRIFRALKDHIHINQERKAQIERDLARTGSKDTYERFLLKSFFLPLVSFTGFFMTGIFLEGINTKLAMTAYILKGMAVLTALILFYEPRSELKRKLLEKEAKVILEMPRFIRTYRYSPHTKGLYRIVEDYLQTAKSGLEYDLQVLKADIDMAGEDKALQNLSNRVNVPEMREFVTVLLTSLKGSRKEADMSLYFVESKFLDKADRLAEDEMKKRPEVLDTINELLLQGLAVLLIIPMAIYCMTGIQDMMK